MPAKRKTSSENSTAHIGFEAGLWIFDPSRSVPWQARLSRHQVVKRTAVI
jgi:hypothetical protein